MSKKLEFTELDQYLFGQGTHYDIYKKLGAHVTTQGKKQGVYFAVWAPNAASVNVIGTFNNWNEESHRMKKLGPGGIYQLFIPGVGENELYKYLIRTPAGEKLYKADPYANYAEMRPGNASRTFDISKFKALIFRLYPYCLQIYIFTSFQNKTNSYVYKLMIILLPLVSLFR